ncbi:MAG: hypothetical protein HZB91_03965 [Elusimicrobia bacterium]|nr:hypothetical protein [Elusimicrobiota bacterium]
MDGPGMKESFSGALFLAAVMAALSCPASGQQADPGASMQQVQQMCSDPKTAAMPMMASVCGQLNTIPKDALTAPKPQTTMQGGGPGFGQPAPGQGGVPGAPGAGAAGGPGAAGGADPGAIPGAGGEGDAGQGGATQTGGVMNYGGGPGQSHVQSIKSGFRQMSKPVIIQKVPKAAVKSKAELAAEAAKRKKEEEEQKKTLARLAEEAKARAAADAAALAKKAAVEAAPPAPAPPLPPPPVYENLVPSEFMVEASLFKDMDASAEFFAPRRISDIVIPPSRPGSMVGGGIVWEVQPEYRFSLCPLEHDPFNLGLPKRISMKRGFWDRIMDSVTGLLSKGGKRSGHRLIPYAAFESGAVDKRMDLLGAGGIVPMSLYWSGPEGALEGPVVSVAQAPGVIGGTGLEPEPGSDDPSFLARSWGLEP